MTDTLLEHLGAKLSGLREEGLYKSERIIDSHQAARISVSLPGGEREVLNFCANNYLGLADHPEVREAAHKALEQYGYGMASVRFICGTQTPHRELERRISAFLGTQDTILYSSCFDANTGFFETVLEEQDAVISDALNHASIIDGIRLCKARRLRYANGDMGELEKRLAEAADARVRLIVTDGVFSMDGVLANLPAICELAERHDAMVMVDDSHATGVMGPGGRGTPAHLGVAGRVDVVTSTLGKALGGASGGFTSGRREIVEWLRQRSRPYLFSNTLAPVIAGTSLQVLDLLESSEEPRRRLHDNAAWFRRGLEDLGFRLAGGEHPIVPVLLGDARLAERMASRLLEEGIYVVSFSFPVVPRGTARIRTQLSAAHTREHLDAALQAFARVGRELGVITGG